MVATASGNVTCAAEHVFLRNEQRLEMADNLKDLVYLDEPNVSWIFPFPIVVSVRNFKSKAIFDVG